MVDLEGRVVGIGVSAQQDPSGYILVNEVYADSPAAMVGLQAGDLIVKVDDLDVNAETYEQAAEAIRGEEGSKVNITYRRDSEDTTIEVTRRKVDIPTVFSRMIDGNVGYVQITEFNESTATQFSNQVDTLIGQGAQALVFDVRNNGGGTLSSVTKMLDKLLPGRGYYIAEYKDGTVEVLAKSDEMRLSCGGGIDQQPDGQRGRAFYPGAAGLWKGQIGRSNNLRKRHDADGEEAQRWFGGEYHRSPVPASQRRKL